MPEVHRLSTCYPQLIMFLKPLWISLGCFSLCAFASCSANHTPTVSKKPTKAGVKKKAFLPPIASPALISKSAALPKDKHGMPTYSKMSNRTRYVRTTAYSHMEMEPGAFGRMNASGTVLKYGAVRSAAADWSVYPLGTVFRIKGLPYTYVVDDYGSALVGTNTIDIFKPSLWLMNKWGTRKTEITVVQWGSFQRSLNLLKGRKGYAHCRKMYYACKRKMGDAYVTN